MHNPLRWITCECASCFVRCRIPLQVLLRSPWILPQVSVKHLMARRMSSTLLPFTFSSCNAELCIIPSSLYELPCNRKRDLRSLDHAPVRLADVQILDRENRSGAVKRYSNLLPGHAEKKLWATVRPEAPQCGNLL